MIPKKIKKIDPPTKAAFQKNYLLKKVPVIIRGLFNDSPISRVRSLEDFAREVPGLKIHVHESYTDMHTRHRTMRAPTMRRTETTIEKFKEYVEFGQQDKGILYTEDFLPRRLARYFKTPKIITKSYKNRPVVIALFISVAGGANSFHFDADCQNVLLHQAFGKKKVIIFPVEQGKKLWPYLKMSTQSHHDMDERETAELIRYAEGTVVTLNAGETLYIPPLLWHGVQYLETGMGVAFRFGQTKLAKFFEDTSVIQDIHWQLAANALYDRDPDDPTVKNYVDKIADCYGRTYKDKFAKYKAMRTLYRQIERDFYDDTVLGMNNYNIIEAIADKDLKREMRLGYYCKDAKLDL